MKKEDIEKLTNSMIEKLGEEHSALIADDIGAIITDNNLMNTELQNKDNQITKLQEDKERLITTNGNLLKQIPMGFEKPKEQEKEENKNNFSFKDVFDEKGNFIK